MLDIYDISPDKFEKLAFEILSKDDSLRVNPVIGRVIGIPYDFTGQLSVNGDTFKSVVGEIKHRKRLSRNEILSLSEKLTSYSKDYKVFALVSSASINMETRTFIENTFKSSGFDEILIYDKGYFDSKISIQGSIAYKSIEKEKRTKYLASIAAAIGMIGSIVGFIMVGKYFYEAEDQSLKARINNVQGALNNISNLENYLNSIKSDLEYTAKESAKIQREYKEALKLKELTQEEIIALRGAVGYKSQSWWREILEYFLGFILGVAASIVASYCYERIKTYWAVNKN